MALLSRSRIMSAFIGLFLVASVLVLAGPVRSETANLPVTVTASPTTNLSDGDVVSINIDAQSPPNASASQIFGADARVCKPNAVIDFSADFNPTQTGNCVLNPLSPGTDAKTTVATAPPNLTAAFSFKVGVGTDNYQTQGGDNISITCGPANPCKLVVKLQVPGTVAFASFPLTYAGAATVPGTPAAPTAVAGNAKATVSWTAPASDGGATIDGYTVTSTPGGLTCAWTTGPLTCDVNGLTNGTAYTFKVKAHNSVGFGLESPASGSVTPVAPPSGSYFHPLAPVRILDSRGPTGSWNGKLAAGTPRALQVTGANGVPANADAVVVNVTVTGGSNNSFVTAYPTGGSVPNASNVNFAVGQTIPNLVTVKVGSGGQVSFANAVGSVDVIADLVGYYSTTTGDKFNALAPVRILDSRGPNGGWNGKLAAGTPRNLQVANANGIPASADAVVMNVTVTGGSNNSFVTAYPTGTARPNASNVNFAVGETIPNLATVKIGTGGQVTFANEVGSAHVIADVVGYYDTSTGDLFHALAPVRILDSRGPNGGWNAKLSSGTPRDLQVTGANGIPAGAGSIIANTTVTGGTANSFVTVYPSGSPVPNASNVNFAVGQTIPNATAVKIGTAGKVAFANAVGSTDVIFDVVGYFSAS